MPETVEAGTDGVTGDGGDVKAVDGDGSRGWVEHAIEGEDKRGLAAAGAAADSDLSARRYGQGDGRQGFLEGVGTGVVNTAVAKWAMGGLRVGRCYI